MSTKFIQLPTCKLAEFINSSATEFDVSGFLYNDGVTPVDPADIGDICFATLEPKTAREELISFTIDSVTAGGVATITAIRGLSQKSPYGTGGAAFDHQNGSDFVISNNPGLFNRLAAKDNDEAITGSWEFPEPVDQNNPVTKEYFEDEAVMKTGNENIDGVKTFLEPVVVPDAVAPDEAVNLGQVEALDDANVKLTGDQTVAGVKTFSSSPIVPTATTATQAVNKSQVEAFVALNSGDIKASDTAFGTTKLDVPADDVAEPEALTATANRVSALSGGGAFGTPGPSNKFVTEEALSNPSFKAPQVVTFTSSGTWTKDAGLKYVVVEVLGAGGAGGAGYGSASSPDDTGGGGGAGGYSKKLISASDLGATEAVTIGAGGTGSSGANGGNGGNSSFGSHAVGNGGNGGIWGGDGSSPSAGGSGGTATSGNLNITGESGDSSGSTDQSGFSGKGANSFYGSGGAPAQNSATSSNNGTGYGAGGSGGPVGSNQNWAGGNGSAGLVIVTEYYS